MLWQELVTSLQKHWSVQVFYIAFYYLCENIFVCDSRLHDGNIVSWNMGKSPNAKLANFTLDMASKHLTEGLSTAVPRNPLAGNKVSIAVICIF